MENSISSIGLIILTLIVFLLLRKFWCWYFRISEMVELQEHILSTLKQINENTLKFVLIEQKVLKNGSTISKNEIVETNNITNSKYDNKIPNIENIVDLKYSEISTFLEKNGYTLSVKADSWIINPSSGSGITSYAYSKNDLKSQIMNIAKAKNIIVTWKDD